MTRRASSGFTLLEVLMATALAGIAVAALLAGISGSLRNLSRAEAYEKAVLVGRAQFNRLLIEETLEPGHFAGRWDNDYRWAADIRRWNPAEIAADPRTLPPLMLVRLTVFWRSAGGEKQATFETCKYQPPAPSRQ